MFNRKRFSKLQPQSSIVTTQSDSSTLSAPVKTLPPEIWLQILATRNFTTLWFARNTSHPWNTAAVSCAREIIANTEMFVQTRLTIEYQVDPVLPPPIRLTPAPSSQLQMVTWQTVDEESCTPISDHQNFGSFMPYLRKISCFIYSCRTLASLKNSVVPFPNFPSAPCLMRSSTPLHDSMGLSSIGSTT